MRSLMRRTNIDRLRRLVILRRIWQKMDSFNPGAVVILCIHRNNAMEE